MVLGFGSMAISKYVMERRNESVLAATRELERILGRAAQGEGVAGLQAMGCEVAGALEPEALAQLGQRLEEEQARKKNRAPERVSLGADLIVYCAKRSEPPSCAAVASSYRAGVASARAFVATVQTPKEVHCSERFAEDGRALGSAAPPNLPPLLPPP